MAKLITGIQGSGKSYKAMHYIATSNDKYYRVYSNLDKLINTRTIFSLDFNSFVNYGLKKCYKIMVSDGRDVEIDETLTPSEIFDLITTQKVSYEDGINYLQEIGILPSVVDENNRVLMIIDEAQDYFGKSVKLSAELLWFITQHRHLYIEVILLAQHHSLIRTDYKLFNEVYDATPPTKQFDKNFFSYHQYAGLPIDESNYVGKIKLKREQKIFAMYKSGDKVDSPNILKRFYVMGIGAIAIILASGYMLIDMFSHKASDASQNSTVKIITDMNTSSTSYTVESSSSQLKYFLFDCISNTCSNKELKIELDISDLRYLVTDTDSKFLLVKKYSPILGSVSLLASQDFIHLFQGADNENKDTKGFSLIN